MAYHHRFLSPSLPTLSICIIDMNRHESQKNLNWIRINYIDSSTNLCYSSCLNYERYLGKYMKKVEILVQKQLKKHEKNLCCSYACVRHWGCDISTNPPKVSHYNESNAIFVIKKRQLNFVSRFFITQLIFSNLLDNPPSCLKSWSSLWVAEANMSWVTYCGWFSLFKVSIFYASCQQQP